jgi:hypothetical protein
MNTIDFDDQAKGREYSATVGLEPQKSVPHRASAKVYGWSEEFVGRFRLGQLAK